MRKIFFLAVPLILASLFAADSTFADSKKCVTETKTDTFNGQAVSCTRQKCDITKCAYEGHSNQQTCYSFGSTTSEWSCGNTRPKRTIGGPSGSGVVKGNLGGAVSPQSPPGALKPTAPGSPPKKQ